MQGKKCDTIFHFYGIIFVYNAYVLINKIIKTLNANIQHQSSIVILMMSRTMIASIGECRVRQTQHGAAKSMRDFMHCGAVMTEGIHFEYMIWALIIMPIALIHSEHVFAYITEVLRAAIRWSRQQTRCARSHCKQMNESIQKWLE